MKPIAFFTLFSFFTFGLISCDNEPLEGEFEALDPTAEAFFTADVDGLEFNAEVAYATSGSGQTEIVGIKANGDVITLTVDGFDTGTYNLTESPSEGNFGISTNAELFSTHTGTEGEGEVTITTFDAAGGLISGTFSLVVSRELVDDDGEPILDEDGNPTYETLDITNGEFSNLPLNGGGTGGDDDDDDGEIDLSVDITGVWELSSMESNGEATAEVGGETVEYSFSAIATELDAQSEFFENPNTVESSGTLTIELSLTIMGQTQTQEQTEEFTDIQGEWEIDGNTFIMTDAEGVATEYEIITLTENTFSLYQEVTETVQGIEYDVVSTMTYTR